MYFNDLFTIRSGIQIPLIWYVAVADRFTRIEITYMPKASINTKHLYNICTTSVQRLRRWSNIVHILYKCFVFTG